MTEIDPNSLAQFGRFRVLLDAIPQPAILKDSCGRIALANEAAARLWRKTPDDLVGLTACDLVDPASACWAEAADTIALHSNAPKLLRHRMKLRGREQSFLVSVAPIYLTREERPDGIIVVVHSNGKVAAAPAGAHDEAVDSFAERQFAELALINCHVRDERQQVENMHSVLDLLCLPDRLAAAQATESAPVTRTAANPLSYLSDDRHWWPLKKLMDTL
jgi:PAS domain-containing protein